MTLTALTVPLVFFFQAAPVPTYTVAGTLVDSVTGAPIAKARVSLAAVAAPFVTGADGAFHFDGVRAVKSQLRAERLGYVTQLFNQRSLFTNLSTGIVIGPDQPTTGLVFRMIPSSVIAGYVRDGNGEPVVGIKVQVIRIFGTGKTQHTGSSTSASTDDRGYYRVRSLDAGSYGVVAAGKPLHEIASVELMAYPVTFYPSAIEPSAAGIVRVGPGEEAPADITLHAVASVHVDGEVPSATGRGVSNMYVGIMAASFFGTSVQIGESASVFNEKFTLQSIPAGSYHVLLIRGAGDAEAAQVLGTAELSATTSPARVSIAEALPLKISVHLTLAGQVRFPTSPLMASLVPLDRVGTVVIPLGPDGRGVSSRYAAAGRYTLLASQNRPLAVTSLAVTGVPQSGVVFEMPETGAVDIEAVATASTVDVSGRVLRDTTPVPGILILLLKRDSWQQIGIYRSDQSDSDGSFTMRDLPAGEYLAFTLERGTHEDYDDVESLRALLPIAQPLNLTDPSSQKVDLKLVPNPVVK